MPRYEDQPTVQVHCHEEAGKLSLSSLIAYGKYRATSLGRNAWRKLIGSQSSLQANCNKEGFNAAGRTTSTGKCQRLF